MSGYLPRNSLNPLNTTSKLAPMSVWASAGASLMPSPVMAVGQRRGNAASS